jgi:hypothetical protein
LTETALARLADLLTNVVRLKSAPDGKVVLVLASGKERRCDRSVLQEGIERLIASRGISRQDSAHQAARTRKRITGQLSHPGAEAEQFEDVKVLFEHEQAENWALTFNVQEASQVADLAAGAGHQQTAALLRLLVHRYQQGKPHRDKQTLRVEELLDVKQGIEFGWYSLLEVESAEKQVAHWQKLLQTLGGMAKGVHAPEIYDAVEAALRRNPKLTPREFWESFNEEDTDSRLYRSTNKKGDEVLRHESDAKAGITFFSLRRYFTQARQSLASTREGKIGAG